MRNITVSLPDSVYRKARIRAAESDTSVSALVRNFLIEIVENESEFERRKRLQDDTIASIRSFSANDRLSRSDSHDRE